MTSSCSVDYRERHDRHPEVRHPPHDDPQPDRRLQRRQGPRPARLDPGTRPPRPSPPTSAPGCPVASFSSLERSAWKVDRDQGRSPPTSSSPCPAGSTCPSGTSSPRPRRPTTPGSTPPTPATRASTRSCCSTPSSAPPTTSSTGNDELLAYAASHAPEPRSKREKPRVSPADLADRLEPARRHPRQGAPRQAFGDLDDASDVLERLADALRQLNDESEPAPNNAAPTGSKPRGKGQR